MGILKHLLGLVGKEKTEFDPHELDLGINLIEQGRYAEACAHLHKLARTDSNSTAVLYNYGAALILNGQEQEALAVFDKAILLDPACWPALINAASIRIKTGERKRAISDFRSAAEPRCVPKEAVLVFAQCLIAERQFNDSRSLLKLHIHRLHSDPTFWFYFAVSCQFLGLALEAAKAFQKALASNQDWNIEQGRAGLLLAEIGKVGESRAMLHRVNKMEPGHNQNLIGHARLQGLFGNSRAAKRAYNSILENAPSQEEVLTNLGNLLKQDGDYTQAELMYRKALQLSSNPAILHKNLSNLLGTTLRVRDAVKELSSCVSAAPQNPYHLSDLLFAQQYLSDLTLDDHKKAATIWGHRFGTSRGVESLKINSPDHRPLRLGLISGSFRQHPVSFLALKGLESLERAKFSIYCYANQIGDDSYTARFRSLSTRWRPTAHLSDQHLAQTVREDGIDILIEMAGHAAGHRLPVVARRLAPVQIKWVGGQFNTIGIESMDYFLSDPIETPPKSDTSFVEKVYRLPEVYACYDPPKDAPSVSPLPANSNGCVTFGSLNKALKLTPETIALWSKCLATVPNSKLLLQGEPFGHRPTSDYAKALFSEHGIDQSRIETRGFTPHPDVLTAYNDIDIALDPVPYSGCLTTCEAMWMGVPVLTLPGATFAARHSASFLNAVGLDDWIATDEEHYVELLTKKAKDLDALARTRKTLRENMSQSALCDAERFGSHLGEALEVMWQEKSAELKRDAA